MKRREVFGPESLPVNGVRATVRRADYRAMAIVVEASRIGRPSRKSLKRSEELTQTVTIHGTAREQQQATAKDKSRHLEDKGDYRLVQLQRAVRFKSSQDRTRLRDIDRTKPDTTYLSFDEFNPATEQYETYIPSDEPALQDVTAQRTKNHDGHNHRNRLEMDAINTARRANIQLESTFHDEITSRRDTRQTVQDAKEVRARNTSNTDGVAEVNSRQNGIHGEIFTMPHHRVNGIHGISKANGHSDSKPYTPRDVNSPALEAQMLARQRVEVNHAGSWKQVKRFFSSK